MKGLLIQLNKNVMPIEDLKGRVDAVWILTKNQNAREDNIRYYKCVGSGHKKQDCQDLKNPGAKSTTKNSGGWRWENSIASCC